MAAALEIITLAPTGSTGNNTHTAGVIHGGNWDIIALQFVAEVVGTTVTYKFQGSLDGVNYYDIGYITDASDTISQATRVRTTVGADVCFVANPIARRYLYYRCVTTGNTGITYRAEAHRVL